MPVSVSLPASPASVTEFEVDGNVEALIALAPAPPVSEAVSIPEIESVPSPVTCVAVSVWFAFTSCSSRSPQSPPAS